MSKGSNDIIIIIPKVLLKEVRCLLLLSYYFWDDFTLNLGKKIKTFTPLWMLCNHMPTSFHVCVSGVCVCVCCSPFHCMFVYMLYSMCVQYVCSRC